MFTKIDQSFYEESDGPLHPLGAQFQEYGFDELQANENVMLRAEIASKDSEVISAAIHLLNTTYVVSGHVTDVRGTPNPVELGPNTIHLSEPFDSFREALLHLNELAYSAHENFPDV